MIDEVRNICDELEEIRGITSFMDEATRTLLRADTGTVPGEKMIFGICCIYDHIDTKLGNILTQVEALKLQL